MPSRGLPITTTTGATCGCTNSARRGTGAGSITATTAWTTAGCCRRDPQAPIYSPLLIARGREIVLSTNMIHTELGNMARDPRTGQEYAQSLVITTDNLGVKMRLAIDTTRLVETMQLPKAVAWDQFYFRFLGDYRMDIEIDGKRDTVRGRDAPRIHGPVTDVISRNSPNHFTRGKKKGKQSHMNGEFMSERKNMMQLLSAPV